MLYLHTAAYCRDFEGGLNATDPALGIRWPIQICEQSTRDAAHPFVNDDFSGVIL